MLLDTDSMMLRDGLVILPPRISTRVNNVFLASRHRVLFDRAVGRIGFIKNLFRVPAAMLMAFAPCAFISCAAANEVSPAPEAVQLQSAKAQTGACRKNFRLFLDVGHSKED